MAFWSNLAKVGLMAAPYVAAPFTGGATLALIGAGAGAGQALAGGGDMKDALIAGGMGAIPGATQGLNRGAQAAIQAGASGGLSTLNTGLESMSGTPFAPAPPPGMAAPTAPPPAPKPSIWSQLARNPETWQAAAQMIAGATEAASRNRSSLGDVQRAEYVAGGGRAYTPAAGLPSYGFGPTAVSGKVQARASELEEELLGRLTPSFWERLGTFAAPAAAIYSTTLPRKQ